jgi:hypothetical protein
MLGTVIGAGIGLVANGIGAWLANKRKKEAEKIQDEYYKGAMADLDAEINSNYLDRADSRNALRKVTDSNTEALRQLNTQAIRGGATDEAKVAMASQLNKRTADVVGSLAAMGQRHKDYLKAEKRGLEADYANTRYQRLADTEGVENMVKGISTAANTLGTSIDLRKSMPSALHNLTMPTGEVKLPTIEDKAEQAFGVQTGYGLPKINLVEPKSENDFK